MKNLAFITPCSEGGIGHGCLISPTKFHGLTRPYSTTFVRAGRKNRDFVGACRTGIGDRKKSLTSLTVITLMKSTSLFTNMLAVTKYVPQFVGMLASCLFILPLPVPYSGQGFNL